MLGAFSIGDWRVDPSLRVVSGVRGESHLEPKHMQVLVLLAEHAGQVVSKERIIQTVWAGTFVGDEVLTKAIYELRRAVDDDPKAPRFIQTIPKGGYRLIAPVSLDQSRSAVPAAQVALQPGLGALTTSGAKQWWLTGGALLLVALASMAPWFKWAKEGPSPINVEAPPMHVVPLTTLTGEEDNPTFSPDGGQVAFEWTGEKQDTRDIYVTLVGSSDVRRLTTDPLVDANPAWSPDGRQIAFLRKRPDGTTIQLVSALGGPDRKLSDFRGADSLAWSPDGHWVAAGRFGEQETTEQPRGIYLIPVEGGEARPLIASRPSRGEFSPAFSPDGRQLAYVSCSRTSNAFFTTADCDIWLVDVTAALAPSTPPRRLTRQRSLYIGGIAWTRGGSAVVYDALLAGNDLFYLWRVGIDGTRPPERIEVAGASATAPAIAPARDRLAFTRDLRDTDIYRFEVGRPVQLVAGSTFEETEPRVSPDGRRLVFESVRSGAHDIWVAQADGSHPQQLTHGPGLGQGAPYWSPDGRRIAFDSAAADGSFHIWMIDTDGGTPRRLTTQGGDEHVPTWSHDGRWVYFSHYRDQGIGRDIWRVSASGGAPERLTHDGSGPFACESADGKTLLFQLNDADSPLMAMPPTGGGARQLLACVRNSAFGAGPQGVYYVPCDVSPNPPVHVLDLKTGRDRRLGTLEGLSRRPLGLSVSPDGKTIVYSKLTSQNTDLMLIENFK